jgi:hypothetical protein
VQTGRSYWGRLEFDFATPEYQAIAWLWGDLCLTSLGESSLPPDSPARRWAQLGTGDPTVEVTLDDLHFKLTTAVTKLSRRATASPWPIRSRSGGRSC